MAGLREMLAPVTVVTGFEKGSGKTTTLRLALPAARYDGPVGVFTIGLEGAGRRTAGAAGTASAGAPAVWLAPGDVTVTTEPLARGAGARLEILDVLPGRSALGRLVLGRAVRGGEIALVGPEHLGVLRDAIAWLRREGVIARALVDGAASRITHVSALDAAFLHTARVDPGNVASVARRLRALEALADAPVEAAPGVGVTRVDGPLTPTVLAELGPRVRAISLADLTQNFLDADATLQLLGRVAVCVRRGLDLRGIVVALRGVSPEAFAAALGGPLGPRYLLEPPAVAA